MFEMEDSKLGRLKVYNVTEARANFATVLREKEAKVVVTWHGRPFKVLVDYQEYAQWRQWKEQNGLAEPESLAASSIQASPLPEAPAGQWNKSDLDQIVRSITENIPNLK